MKEAGQRYIGRCLLSLRTLHRDLHVREPCISLHCSRQDAHYMYFVAFMPARLYASYHDDLSYRDGQVDMGISTGFESYGVYQSRPWAMEIVPRIGCL